MASLSVDRMRPADLDAVLAIERASFSMPSTTISSSARRSSSTAGISVSAM